MIVTLLLICLSLGSPASGQQPPPQTGSIHGEVTTQNGTIALGGVQIIVRRAETEIASVASEGDGTFRFDNVAPGDYTVTATLEGFSPRSVAVQVAAGQIAEPKIDLPLSVAATVEVSGVAGVVPPAGTLSGGDTVGQQELEQITSGGGLQAAFRILASVIEVPGGVAIKGGRPNQASLQIGPGLFVDPATGLTQGTLPDDAIEAVTVLPNPYAVEFGRFSSGLVVIQTRRAPDTWKARIGQLDPSFRTKRGQPLNIQGISAFSPRFEVGGPIRTDRVYLHQSAQYRYRANDVESRPENELRTSHRFSSFTRVDAKLSDNHSIIAVGGIFPSRSKFATLGTFTPPDATVDLHSGVDAFAVTERTVWSETRFSETTLEVNRFHVDVRPQGSAVMELLPETTIGNFFNHQERTASSYQVIHSLSGTNHTRFGLHMYKAGVDIVGSRFEGTSGSRPILIRRSDGTLSRRLDFETPASQSLTSTDLALFVQDRIQPGSRWYVELGARLDRDGVIDRFNVTPRVGAAFLLNKAGTAVLRTGYGLFYERTPLTVGVFHGFERFTERRFAEDGVTQVGPDVPFIHTFQDEPRTPRSTTWDVAYDHRLNSRWAVHVGAIDRRGSHEYIVDRVTAGDLSELRLRSAGKSEYREAEFGIHFTGGAGLDLKATYVRSQARADLNALTSFYDSVLSPVLGENAFAPARADVPHRLLARWRAMPTPNWLLVGVLDWRTGLPFSTVDESLDFVGPRNRERFPAYFRLDLGVEHRIRIFNLRPWVGIRADNALNRFLPSDVQANISSPAFRTFYNSEYRQFRIQVRFER